MKLNVLVRIADAIETIQENTDASIPDIVKALEGVAFSKEECYQILNYHQSYDD